MTIFAEGDFLSVAQTADILAVGTERVYALIQSGELPAFRVGARGPWRISREALQLFINQALELENARLRWHEVQCAAIPDISDAGPRAVP